MKLRRNLPEPLHKLEHVWISMPDGVRLSARIWRPVSADQHPVPAILEYIPYRKRDGVRQRDESMHGYLAAHGYACVRVDLRGSGDSEGLLADEYLPQELDDAEAVLAWLGTRPWCNGRLGMMGISWGGFNALQVAARRPEGLQAVVAVCATDDRYADDVHYMGGCLLGDNLSWASTMLAYNSLPPDPLIVGRQWRDQWLNRLAHCQPWLETWLRHPHRDAYWQHGSICEDFQAVQVPVMAVSGWADGYSNAVFRMLTHLHGARLGLIGPWSHMYPHLGVPGPAIGFLQECLRWWDHWLKDADTGIMHEPMLRAWMLDSMPPSTRYHQRYGHWVSEPSWPSPRVELQSFRLDNQRLVATDQPVENHVLSVQSPLSTGLFAGKWCSYSATPDLPHDQREEDGGALVFTSAPLTEPLEVLGAPVLELVLEANQPVAMVAVRLSDQRPDHKVTRVTYGLLNLTHRHGHGQPEPMPTGKTCNVRVQLNDIGQQFPAGHRLQIAVSTSYFPLAWPPPRSVQLRIHTGLSRLLLPVRPVCHESISFPSAEAAPAGALQRLAPSQHEWRVVRELDKDNSMLEVINDAGTYHLEDIDVTVQRSAREWYRFRNDDFSSVSGETLWHRGLSRGDWSVNTVSRTVLRCDPDNFYLDVELDAHENQRRVFSRNWRHRIPRKLV